MKKTMKGFTLIELLIVIAVIAILAAIAIPNLLASKKGANEANAISTLKTVCTLEETYKSRNLGTTAGYANSYGPIADLVATSLIKFSSGGGSYVLSQFNYADIEAPTQTTYAISATPLSAAAGDRSFAISEDGFVRETPGIGGITDRTTLLGCSVVSG